MKKSILSLLAVAAILVNSASLNAQEKGGKTDPAKAMVTQFMKQLEKAELKDEETAKIKDMFEKVAKEVAAKRSQSGITADILKKRTEASKAAKEAGKKGKELQAAAEAAMGLTPDQTKVFKETEETLGKVRVEIGKLLTAEQLAKMPEQAQNAFKEKSGKGKKANK